MGCSTIKLDAEDSEIRDWALDDPHGQDPDTVREIRDDIERRFKTLFDELYLGEP
jgi:protein-tyrosine-phosphatase